MLEAQKLAREERRRVTLAKRALFQDKHHHVPEIIRDPVDTTELPEDIIDNNSDPDSEIDPIQVQPQIREEMETDYNTLEPLRILQTGPYRWTPEVTNEYISKFKTLEGKLYAHPRTRRIYEITTVFFHPIKKIAAAYSRIVDGGQPDVHDLYPSRIEGELGLEELVKHFETAGGSTGKSKTKWPDNAEAWEQELNKDPYWGPKLKPLQIQLHEKRASEVRNGKTPEEVLQGTHINPSFVEHERIKFKYNGLLYMLSTTGTDGENSHTRHRLVVPQSLHKNILELYHDTRGHPGSIRTRDTILLHYWWPHINGDVDKHCKSCLPCARRKSKGATGAVDIQHYNAPDTPWARTHMDLTGPIRTSKSGNNYILVIKDSLTRYVETIPLKTKTKEEIAEALVREIICRYGGFGHLITDNGKEFDNKLMAQITHLLGIKHTTTSPYNPRANGLAENHMRILKDALAMYCQETQDDWDTHLRGVTMAYNTTVNSQTGFTPYYMMYGREAILPMETWMREYQTLKTSVIMYVQNLAKALSTVWEMVAAKKPREYQRMLEAQRPVRHLKFHEYTVGDLVMISSVPKQKLKSWIEKEKRVVSAALQPRYSGPYPIVKTISPVIYIVKINGIDRIVHAINMKLFKGKQTYTTPYVQHGFERSEASKNIPKEPLLMSPDPKLNETTRIQYRKRNSGLQRDYTRKSKLKIYRKAVDKEMSDKQLLSESKESLDRYLEEYANVENDEEVILHNDWLIERERLRILLLDETRSDFARKSQSEQEYELKQLSKLGYSMEDLVDQVVDRQEHEWLKAARNENSPSEAKDNGDDSSTDASEDEEIEIVQSKIGHSLPRRR
jgi:transposase InsO family protein